MNLAVVMEFSAATLGLSSGILFCLGVLSINDKTLRTIGESMWGSKPALARELALQKVDFMIGALLLALSFLAQVVGKFLPSGAAPGGGPASIATEALVGAGAPLVLVALLWPARSFLRKAAIERLSPAPSAMKE